LPPDLRDYLRLLAEREGESTEAASEYL
jgi:hypothetical protein